MSKQQMYTTGKPGQQRIFFTSDTHFGHSAIIKYCRRPFESIEEHDAVLMRRWNDKVRPDDLVFHLGDIGFGNPERLNAILRHLNGKIVWVIGNHDWRLIKKLDSERFETITQQVNMNINNQHIYLNHFPMLAFSGAYRGLEATWQLFGHVHTSPYTDEGLDQQRMKHLFTTQYDVGVDNNDFTPVSFEEVKQIIENQQMSLGMCRNEK